MPELVERVWQGGGYGRRRDRRPFRYHAFVPDGIGEWDEPVSSWHAFELSDLRLIVRY